VKNYPVPEGIDVDRTLDALLELVGKRVLVTDSHLFAVPGVLRHWRGVFSIPVEEGFLSFRQSDVYGTYLLGVPVVALA